MMVIQKRIAGLLMLSVTASPFAVYANDVLSVEKAWEMLITYSVSEALGRENFPEAQVIGMGSLAGYLHVVIDGVPFHLVVLPSTTMKYKSKYATTIEIKDIAGLDGAIVTPAVAETWVKIGLTGQYEYRVTTTQVGQVLITLVSDKPFNELLNPSAQQGQKITTGKAQQ